MRQWYYALGEQKHGPVDEPDFLELFENGQLGQDSWVWTEELDQWSAARDLEDLIPPVEIPLSRVSVSSHGRSASNSDNIRPWVRFWSRAIDLLLFAYLVSVVLSFINVPLRGDSDLLIAMVILFVYAFVESALLSSWGATPGKALLNVRLTNRDGSKLTYSQSQTRSLKVWLKGLGLGIPLVSLIAMIVAHGRLTKEGVTSWDEEGEFVVSHGKVGAGRAMAAVAIIIGVIILRADAIV